MASEIFCWLQEAICSKVQNWFPIHFHTQILIQFNDAINIECIFDIQCLIQYSMNHSMFNEGFKVQWTISCLIHIQQTFAQGICKQQI